MHIPSIFLDLWGESELRNSYFISSSTFQPIHTHTTKKGHAEVRMMTGTPGQNAQKKQEM